MEQKKYNKIERKINGDFLQEGATIIIQEKIDGANASFRKDEDGNLRVFSRNKELDEHNTLGGFYNWAVENINPEDLEQDTVYFGEWTTKHKVDYGENTNKFYLFDVFKDDGTEEYLNFLSVQHWADKLGLNLVPVLYQGEFQSIDHLKSFVGQTKLNGKINEKESGEGIVIKRYEYKDRFGYQKHYKLVTDVFSEKKQGEIKQKKATEEQKFVNKFVTKARVEKNLFKLFDEGELEGNAYKLEYEDLGRVLKPLVNLVREDIIEEELESFEGEEPIDKNKVNKALGGLLAKYVRGFIDEKNEKEFDNKTK